MARVAVCIPTYNRSSLVRGAIESALSQGYEDLVVAVSDNASEDDTTFVVESIGDPRIRYSCATTSDTGLVDNFNSVMTTGDTEFLVVLPDDDRLLPGGLERAGRGIGR